MGNRFLVAALSVWLVGSVFLRSASSQTTQPIPRQPAGPPGASESAQGRATPPSTAPDPSPAAAPSGRDAPSRAATPPSSTPLPPPPAAGEASFLLASVPNMFGDFHGGSLFRVGVTAAPIPIRRTFPQFLPLPNGQSQLFFDPTGQVIVFNSAGAQVPIAQQIGPGIDRSGPAGDPQDTFPISDPTNSPVTAHLRPQPPGPGTIVFRDGFAIFTGQQRTPPDAPDGLLQPAPGFPDGADQFSLDFTHLFIPNPMTVVVPTGGAAVRRVKLAENSSPQPRDRFLFNYNYFNNVIGGFDENRFTVGMEKTFFNGKTSIEVRMPIAGTLSGDQIVGGGQLTDTENGNLTVVSKIALWQNDRRLISGGVGIAAPTGSDARLFLPDGRQILQIRNEGVHLLPFIAAMSVVRDRDWFWQVFLQLDIDLNGNPAVGDAAGVNPTQIGVLQDPTLLFLDWGIGYLLYEDPCAELITSFSPIAEVHYSTTLQDSDFAVGNGLVVGDLLNHFDVVNLTIGADVGFRNRLSIRPAMAIPLARDHNKHFDYEAIVQANWWY